MLKEFIDAIGQLKEQSLKAESRPFDRLKDRNILRPDGTIATELADFPDRNHVAGDLSVIQKLVEEYNKDDDKRGRKVEVWFNRTGVTVIFDADAYRRNRATMSLGLSYEIRRLGEIARKPFPQAEIIKLLRNDFRCCEFSQTVTTLRNVKFELNQSGEMSVERTKTSIGKSQLAKIYGLDALAEAITFTIPVFESKFRQLFNVAAALDPDPEAKTFTLTPYPGQIEAAIEAAEEALGLQLEAMMPEGIGCFFGTP